MAFTDIFKFNLNKVETPSNPLKLSKEKKKVLIELNQKTTNLTKKDIASWRRAWQMAINIENPRRANLYDIYNDSLIDLHLSGCIEQRTLMVKKKSFRVVDKNKKENQQLTELLEADWFKQFMQYTLESRFWGHSLIEFGYTENINNRLVFSDINILPRKHVIPEYGVFVKNIYDDISKGINYKEGIYSQYLVEAGRKDDLGLLLKCSPQAISKRYALSYWDAFGEMFGAPVRIAKTTSRDPKDTQRIEAMMEQMGALSWGVFPEGTEVEFKETSRGDAFNVYDKRIDRANSEISKGILNQTMTIDSGSSLSQSEIHLEVFENVIESDADFLRDVINDKLFPFLIKKGFPLLGYRFDWDDAVDYTTEDMKNIEQMLISGGFDIDPKYFVDKYNIPIIGKKEQNFFD